MRRRMLAFCVCVMLVFAMLPARGDILIRWHDADGTDTGDRDSVKVIVTDHGPEEGSFAYEMAGHAFVSQRDSRYAVPGFLYINREPFSKNGCGPSSLFNAMEIVFGDMSDAGLLELMVMMADFHRPADYGINYNRIMDIGETDPGTYPVIAASVASVDNLIPMRSMDEETVLALAGESTGRTVLFGRFSLTKSTQAFVRIAQGLCALGHEDAVLCIATVSAGTAAVMSPFGMGPDGHYVTLVCQAGEFCRSGTVYVVDSYPRALRDETLNDLYPVRYYFAASNGMSAFRRNYHVERLQPTVLVCRLDATLLAGMANPDDVRERAALLNMITTYGTGTLFIRLGH